MFYVRNVPVVIEPGIGALEAEFSARDEKNGERFFPVQLQRVTLDKNNLEKLPLIPSTKFPHVFSLIADLDKACVLLIYDFLGRLTTVYTRSDPSSSWNRSDVADEHAGKTVTQFSVRFSFNTAKDREKFMDLAAKLTEGARAGGALSQSDVLKVFNILARSRNKPVVLPVAVAKLARSGVKP